MWQMMASTAELDPDVSEDSDEERETKYNLLDMDEADVIEEEEEGADCEDCYTHNNDGGDSSEELPLIKDSDRQRFKPIQQIESDEDLVEPWDISTSANLNKNYSGIK